jgi:hypothetical protein
MIPYREQWKDPRWQKKRLEAMQEAQWECEKCGDKGTTLNVHHRRYVKGRMVWEYELAELAVLCEPCHLDEHADRELLDRLIVEAGSGSLEQIIGLAGGYLDANCSIDPGLGYMTYEARELYYELGVVAAAAELLGIDAWRQIVRTYVSANPSCPPTFRVMVQKWDEADKK